MADSQKHDFRNRPNPILAEAEDDPELAGLGQTGNLRAARKGLAWKRIERRSKNQGPYWAKLSLAEYLFAQWGRYFGTECTAEMGQTAEKTRGADP